MTSHLIEYTSVGLQLHATSHIARFRHSDRLRKVIMVHGPRKCENYPCQSITHGAHRPIISEKSGETKLRTG